MSDGDRRPAAKHCPKCDTTKPAAEFHCASGLPDGLQPHCKQCKAEHARRRWITNGQHMREVKRSGRVANREGLNEYNRQYYADNGEGQRAKNRAWKKANPHQGWLKDYNARCREYGITPVVNPFTRDELKTLIAEYRHATKK